MSDLPPFDPTPQHPAPRAGWLPLSALAVTSFALSLLLILVALPGLWIVQVVPLALGIYALMKVRPGERRGRVLAVWGVLIALAVGSCSFMMHHAVRGTFAGAAESVLSVLSSQDSADEKSKSLRSWAWPKALEKDETLLTTWMDRYATVSQRYGAWTERLEMPSVFTGSWPLLMAPDGVVEVGTDDARPPGWTVGSVIWAPAAFEKGTVYVALVMQGGDADATSSLPALQSGQESPIFGDVRFFVSKSK